MSDSPSKKRKCDTVTQPSGKPRYVYPQLAALGIQCDVGRTLKDQQDVKSFATECHYSECWWSTPSHIEDHKVYCCGKRHYVCDKDKASLVGICCICHIPIVTTHSLWLYQLQTTPQQLFSTGADGDVKQQKTIDVTDTHLYLCKTCRPRVPQAVGGTPKEEDELKHLKAIPELKYYTDFMEDQKLSSSLSDTFTTFWDWLTLELTTGAPGGILKEALDQILHQKATTWDAVLMSCSDPAVFTSFIKDIRTKYKQRYTESTSENWLPRVLWWSEQFCLFSMKINSK